MPANLEKSAVATGLEKVSFHLSGKEPNYSAQYQERKEFCRRPQGCLGREKQSCQEETEGGGGGCWRQLLHCPKAPSTLLTEYSGDTVGILFWGGWAKEEGCGKMSSSPLSVSPLIKRERGWDAHRTRRSPARENRNREPWKKMPWVTRQSFSTGAVRLNMSDKQTDFPILKNKLASKCLHKSQTASAKEERLVRQQRREGPFL